MENEPMDYEPGEDQNQGVVGTMARNQQHGDTEKEGTQEAGLDPNLVTNGHDETAENESGQPTTDRIGEQEFVTDQGVD
ncbi:hypothetical protein [Fibrella forsythiae]|uniref:Uncharacterized protein n=1 Tax=Fibrella forsythiae TaxID=2817061 RepID=A0ABS3JFG0_9BACT|nr:hypothetical protein [Fibrella forsythiae]MBO0948730.1 hypothetical protein [Fibrella forsythiae]